MKELSWKDLGITFKGMIHIDNTSREDLYSDFKTWCGLKLQPAMYSLTQTHKCSNIKLCKKCSHIYYKKYKEPFVSHIATLKLKDKLFI